MPLFFLTFPFITFVLVFLSFARLLHKQKSVTLALSISPATNLFYGSVNSIDFNLPAIKIVYLSIQLIFLNQIKKGFVKNNF